MAFSFCVYFRLTDAYKLTSSNTITYSTLSSVCFNNLNMRYAYLSNCAKVLSSLTASSSSTILSGKYKGPAKTDSRKEKRSIGLDLQETCYFGIAYTVLTAQL